VADARPIARAPRGRVIAAFAAVYLIWGSTYLGIRLAIETIPPFLMGGVRFLIAGGVLYLWARWRGAERPTRAHWVSAVIIGALLLLGGNGAVVWSEQRVPSSIAALLVATVPLWMVLLDWMRRGGTRPTAVVTAGVVLGLAGIALLVRPGAKTASVNLIGAGVLVLGSLSWAVGSLYARRVKLPPSPLLATAMEMLGGGALLTALAALSGETRTFHLANVSAHSAAALLYLIAFGSLVAFTAYVWLLEVSTPARVSTYAYVNPVVAVLLGWIFAGEPLTGQMLIAAAVIVGAVALITAGSLGAGRKASSTRELPSRQAARVKEGEAPAA
jgi:drug/metabolite transporter (DMT)-like permease